MSEIQIDHLAQARALIDVRRYREALACLRQHLALDPDDSGARLLQCNCHFGLNDPVAAKACAKEALRRDPTCHRALYYLSIAQGDYRNQPTMALETICKALELNPDDPDYHAHCGFCLMNLSRVGEALASARQALSLEPSHLNARLCEIQALMDLKDETAVVKSIQQALALHPDTGEAHFFRALAFVQKGDAAAARECLREAQRLVPQKATLFSQELNAKVRECRSAGLGCGMMLCGALFLIGLLIMFGGGV